MDINILNLVGVWAWVVSALVILVIVFVIFQFFTMIISKKLRKVDKGVWTILFIFFSLITALMWFIIKRLK